MNKIKGNKAITLIALIITIIVLLILAGVVINMTVGNNGIIAKSQVATEKYKEAAVKEELEILMTEAKLQAMDEKKDFTAEYFKTYLETKLENKVQAQIDESGVLQVTLDGFTFPVSIANGIASIGQAIGTSNGQSQQPIVKNIKIETTKQVANDYTKVTIKAEIEYDGDLSSVKIGNTEVENLASKKEGNKYTITKEVTANGNYEIEAIGEQGKTQSKTVTVDEVEEDLTITSAEGLARFRDRVNNGATYEGKTVTLGADIDMSSVCYPASEGKEKLSWIPIGHWEKNFETNEVTKDYKFKGTFDGNYKTISNLYINDENLSRAGLFGQVDGATIQNVVFREVNILAYANIASVVGFAENGSLIQRCLTDGNVSAISNDAAGVVAILKFSSICSSCVSNCSSISAKYVVGGIVARRVNASIYYCFNKSSIYASSTPLPDNRAFVGGVCGHFQEGEGNITNCYSIGIVDSIYSNGVGLVVGTGDNSTGVAMANCFAVNFSNYQLANNINPSNSRVITKGSPNVDNNELTQWTQEQINANLRKSGETNEIFVKDTNNKNRGYPLLKWQVEHGIY